MPIPNVPANVLITPGNGRVFISWDSVAAATSASTGVPLGSTGPSSGYYDVLRSDDGVTYSIIGSPRNTFYSDIASTAAGGASTGVVLRYRVRANGDSGQSNGSEPIPTVLLNSGQASLAGIRLAAQQRADMVNSDFVTKQEWIDYINHSYTELYDLLIQVYGDEYYVATPFTFNTDSRNPGLYDLPSNHYKLLGVELSVNTNAWRTLTRYSFINRNNYLFGNTSVSAAGITNLKYRLIGNQIQLVPLPSGGQTIRLWFIPRPVFLQADSDVLDGISGWDEYVIVDSAIKAMQKEESDITILMAQKQALLQRITAAASNRDVGIPEQVSDIRGLTGYYSDESESEPRGGW